LHSPYWPSFNLYNGLPCRTEYFEPERIGLVYCHEGPDTQGKWVHTLRFLSPSAYAEVRKRGSTLTGGVVMQLLLDLEKRGARDTPASHAGPPPDLRFAPEEVAEVRVSVKWPSNDLADQPVQAVMRRPINAAPLAALGKNLGRLTTVPELRSCEDPTEERQQRDIYHAEVALSIHTAKHGEIKLRSNSACAWMLPWNITDGEWLLAAHTPAVGQAIRDLVMPLCPACRFDPQPVSEEPSKSGADSRFSTLFQALLAQWERLSAQKLKDAEIDRQTEALRLALRWMDSQRFDGALAKVLRLKRAPEPVQRLIAIELVSKSNF